MSVEIIKQFQHFTGRDGGGGGRETRDLWRTPHISVIRWYHLSNWTQIHLVSEWGLLKTDTTTVTN